MHNHHCPEAGVTTTDVSLVLRVEELAGKAPILAAKLARLDPRHLTTLLGSPAVGTSGGATDSGSDQPGSPEPQA
ncbi:MULTISPECIES: hypothetical protein [Paenarthrobacter]|uniref:hypothetical protein n=1 Tax=Paenarthrobacter TaxID=1742992 RepID=UPI00140DA72D|nr:MULTISPECIES: hypothetical protein [Paenarthrobacter]MCX8453740.1 hypothetical protein [Paenarthrobacter ureafaciens]MCY0973399.1 hypothetical protein [Paenarthrobacter ureafaciens]QOT17408.1 hypothetical protein HMI59_12880 [Paenarthrobacter sp. YJN-5]